LKAAKLPDGRMRLVLARREEFTLSDLYRIHNFLGEALHALRHGSGNSPGLDRDDFQARVGITVREARSLDEELFLIRYDVLGVPRPAQDSNRRLWSLVVPGRTRTAWDQMPKIEAELMTDDALALVLGREELSIFASCVDVALEEMGAKRSNSGWIEFGIRTGMEPEEAEAFRDELLQLNQEAWGKSGDGQHPEA
jgi:hypothetical protein